MKNQQLLKIGLYSLISFLSTKNILPAYKRALTKRYQFAQNGMVYFYGYAIKVIARGNGSEMIDYSFTWSETEEGRRFWLERHKEYEDYYKYCIKSNKYLPYFHYVNRCLPE